jgi:hypothetical protein
MRFIIEAYTPAQLALGTGGPKSPELLMTLAVLREELAGLGFLIAREIEREVIEGDCHTGRGAVQSILSGPLRRAFAWSIIALGTFLLLKNLLR